MGIAVSVVVIALFVLFFIGLGPAKTTAKVVTKTESAVKATPAVIAKAQVKTTSAAKTGGQIAKTGGHIGKIVLVSSKDATVTGLKNFRENYKQERENLKATS